MPSRKVLLFFFLIVIPACSSQPNQQQELAEARAKLAAEQAKKPKKYDVVIIPTAEFPQSVIGNVAETIAKDTDLKIYVASPQEIDAWKSYAGSRQYNPDELKSLAVPNINQLKELHDSQVHILLTSRDINTDDKSAEFHFSTNYPSDKISIVSVARLLYEDQGGMASQEAISARLRKMLLRTVVLQFYDKRKSSDIRDITYSPLVSIVDVDKMGLNFDTY